jgi:ferric-dicitrate binding protein FerR (iron transport regulator)
VSTLRDERLGAALRALETPEHRPGFYAELHRLLAEEHAARTAEARRQQRARRARTRWGARVAVVAAVAAAVWLVVGLPENERVPDVIRTEDPDR